MERGRERRGERERERERERDAYNKSIATAEQGGTKKLSSLIFNRYKSSGINSEQLCIGCSRNTHKNQCFKFLFQEAEKKPAVLQKLMSIP